MRWQQPHPCGLLEMQAWEPYRYFNFLLKKANSFLNGINFHLQFSSQRLAEDKNPAIANAASKTIHELKKQWEIQEGDSWRFMMNQKPVEEVDSQEDNNDADTG